MKFVETEVFNFNGAFRGLRNPKDSWDKSDSYYENGQYILGSNDIDLAQRMILGGRTHSKFLRQILVSVDITAPRYWWSEYDTYKISTTANSCSTMHKLTTYPMIPEMFNMDGLNELDDEEDDDLKFEIIGWWTYSLELLEKIRAKGIDTKKFKYKRIMKQMLPEGFYQKRTLTLNYENVRNIVGSRNHHQLSEWHLDFIEWAKTLPYSEELIFYALKEE